MAKKKSFFYRISRIRLVLLSWAIPREWSQNKKHTTSRTMRKSVVYLTALLALGQLAVAQTKAPKLVEEVKKTGDELVIPYKKYKMDNGLTVILHEDHSDPIVYVDVTYHVGSGRELPGRSGFAHFFEHMMFQGSDNVGDEEHFKIVTESGGQLNGTTNRDRTNYFETMPSNQLETALWLEADRMGFFLDAVTVPKFEVQRATVKNERGQNYDNRPYGLVSEKMGEIMYPFGHPYSWTTIGYIDDLNAATLDDLKNFFLRWYGPNNATLTIAGDLDPEQALKWVAKYFGNIPMGPAVSDPKPNVPVLKSNQYISYEDNVKLPMLRMAWPTVPQYSEEEASLDALADALAGSKTSPFYQKFIKGQIALNAAIYHPCSELSGNLELILVPYPGKTLAEMEKLVQETLKEFNDKGGISQEELDRFKSKIEADNINELQSVRGKGAKLAAFQTFEGNPNLIAAEMKKYRDLTVDKVNAVFKKYMLNKPYAAVSVVPKGQTALVAAPDNAKRPETPAGFKNDISEYQNLKYVKGKDDFDRKKRPAAGANPVVKVPEFWNSTLPNGLQTIGTSYNEIPVTNLTLYVKAGQIRETEDKAGLAALTASLMGESTENYTAEAIGAELEKLGSSIDIYSDREDIVVSVTSLNKNLDRTLELMKEMIFKPKFSEEEFKRLVDEQKQSVKNRPTQAAALASDIFRRVMLPTGAAGLPEIGTDKSVSAITLDDVKAYYKKWFTPDQAQMTVVGNLTAADLKTKLAFLGSWAKGNTAAPAKLAMKAGNGKTIYFVDKPGAAQSEIRIGWPTLYYDATGPYYSATIMNYALGGAFNSRVNLNLREKNGWTYGARAGFRSTPYENLYAGSAGVKLEATDSAVGEFIREITEFRKNGIREDELTFTKSSMGQSEALKYETPGQKSGFLKLIMDNGYDKQLSAKRNSITGKVTKAEIDALAKNQLKLEEMVVVVVGDKAKLMEKMKTLGYDVVELPSDMEGISNKLK